MSQQVAAHGVSSTLHDTRGGQGEVALGFEIEGLDLRSALTGQEFRARVLNPLMAHSAVVIRGQDLTPEQLIAFSAQLGRLESHVFNQHLLHGHPEILLLSNVEEGGRVVGRPNPGEFWHTDLTYTQTPNRFSVLYSLEIPHARDGTPLGTTLFRSSIQAYDTLPETTKREIEGLTARHFHLWVRRKHGDDRGIELSDGQKARMVDVLHPVVCQQPETSRRYLFVNHAHTVSIEGYETARSDALLEGLYRHFEVQPTYAHRWQVGDVVIWDNFTTQHFATLDYAWPQRRRMWRLSVAAAEPPRAASAATRANG